MSDIETCIIPSAGAGSRWMPVSSYVPKQMLPLRGRPIMEHVVREAIDSGCTEIVIIVNKRQSIIKDYLQSVEEFKKAARLHFLYQDNSTRGVAETVLLSREHIKQDSFVLLFPDIPAFYRGKPPLKELVEGYRPGNDSHAYAFAPWPDRNWLFFEYKLRPRKDEHFDIEHICPKPQETGKFDHPENNLMPTGRIVYNTSILPIFEECLKNSPAKEVSEIPVLTLALDRGHKFTAMDVNGYFFDTGIPAGYEYANGRLLELAQKGLV